MEEKTYYSYALDENQCLINAHDAQKGHEYFCLSCGSIMIPKQGKIRTWHFAHKVKNDKDNCSYETYIHKLAKEEIRKCFLESEKFEISFSGEIECNVNECPLEYQNLVYLNKRCKGSINKTFDLKKWYDSCEEEEPIDDFRADLLLKQKEKKEIPPILIEICVTHESTEKKLNSNYKIIEIHIATEEDIENVISAKRIVEKTERSVRDRKKVDDRVLFYNFKKTVAVSPHKLKEVCPKVVDCLAIMRHDTENATLNTKTVKPKLNPWELSHESRRCLMCKYSCTGCQLYERTGIAPFENISMDTSCHHFHHIRG